MCEFCKAEFSVNSSLQRHIKTSKTCLQLRSDKKENQDKKKIVKQFECHGCSKNFTNKKNMNTHIEICEEIRVKKIKEEHKKELEKLNKDHIKEIEELNKDHIKELKLKDNIINDLKKDITDLQEKFLIYKTNNESNKHIVSQPINTNSIHNFKLTLEDNSEITIPVRSDGYVNVTLLCKASNKRIDNWKATKESKALLASFKAIPDNQGIAILDIIKGGNISESIQGTFAHPDIAIQIAQWCSPNFALQVSRWVRELLFTGKVELSDNIINKNITEKRLSLDIQPYLLKDVLYIFEFKPNIEDMLTPNTLHNKNIHYFEFGISSDIQKRQNNYGLNYRLDKIFVYDARYKISLAEKYVKKLVIDLDLKFKYKNKIECMQCTYEELDYIYTLIDKHNMKSKEEPEEIENDFRTLDENEYIFELQKLQIQTNAEIEKERIKSDNDNNKKEILMKMKKEGLLTFEEFRICFKE